MYGTSQAGRSNSSPNLDGLAKSLKRHLYCTEIQIVKTFPPSLATFFTTPTNLRSEKTVTPSIQRTTRSCRSKMLSKINHMGDCH